MTKNIVRHRPNRRHGRRHPRGGAAIVEGAIVLGVFLAMLLGTLDLGLAMLRKTVVTEAARRLAREAITHGSMAGPEDAVWGPGFAWWNPLYGSSSISSDGSTTLITDGGGISAAVEPVLFTLDPQYTWVYVDWPDGGNRPGQRVRVWVFYWHKSLVPFVNNGYWLLHSTCVMRVAH